MGSPEAEIRALIEERIAAMRAKDAARAIATLADDVVAFGRGFGAWVAFAVQLAFSFHRAML